MSDLIVALGMALVLEGVVYAIFPGAMRAMIQSLATLSDQALRVGGVACLALGVFIIWMIRGGNGA